MGKAKDLLSRKVFWHRTLQVLIAGVITAFFVYFISRNLGTVKKAFSMPLGVLAVLVGLSVINRLLAGLKMRTIMKLFDIDLRFAEWFGCAAINNLYNYFISKSGAAITSVYMKKKHGLRYSRYISLFAGDVLVAFFVSGLLGAVCSFFAWGEGAENALALGYVFLFLTLAALVVILMPDINFKGEGALVKRINNLLHGWNLLRKDLLTVLVLSFLNLMIMVTFALRYYLILREFSGNVPFYVTLVIAPLSVIVQFISVIPGAYGLREAVAGFATGTARMGFSAGAIATLVDRVIMMAVAFVLGTTSSYFLLGKRPGKIEEDKIEE